MNAARKLHRGFFAPYVNRTKTTHQTDSRSENPAAHCFLTTTYPRGPGRSVHGERANFTSLVLGCIEAKFCKYILVGKLSPRSTQCTPLHRSQSLIKKSLKIWPIFFAKLVKIYLDFQIFGKNENLRNFGKISKMFSNF